MLCDFMLPRQSRLVSSRARCNDKINLISPLNSSESQIACIANILWDLTQIAKAQDADLKSLGAEPR